MKKLFLALASVAVLTTSCCGGVSSKADLKTAQDSVSYALGVAIGQSVIQNLKQMPFDTIDVKLYAAALANSKPSEKYITYVQGQLDTIYTDIFMDACRAQIALGKAAISFDEAQALLNNKAAAKRQEMQALRDAQAIENERAGRAFLESNIKNEGVDSTATGLQYKIITAGNGPKPTATDRVKVNYRGTLIDGTEFDASKEGEPATLAMRGVIKGWTEALQMMPVGSKWQIYVPSNLAYGKHGAGEKIGPGATLIFDIELVEIVK